MRFSIILLSSLLFFCVVEHVEPNLSDNNEELLLQPEDSAEVFTQAFVDITVGVNRTLDKDERLQFRIKVDEDWHITRAVIVHDTTYNITADVAEFNVTVKGEFLGYADVQFYLCSRQPCHDTDFVLLNKTFKVKVLRVERFVDTLFTVVIICMSVLANLVMGCAVDTKVVKEVLRRPTAPVIGFLCQFAIMPPLSFLLARLFQLSLSEQIGVLALGSSPGGGASNMWTLLFDGDVSLSVTMTLISTLASLAMFPLWIFTLGKIIMDEANFVIPFQNILFTLVSIVVPVGIGVLLQRKLPNVAKIIVKIIKPMLFIFLIFIFTFGTWVNLYMFLLFHWKLIVASCLLPWLGFVLGALVAWICRQTLPRIIAICLETGIQNTGVAIFALKLSLPQPENDLSIIGAVTPTTFTAFPLIIAYLIVIIRTKFCKMEEKSGSLKEEERNGITNDAVTMTGITKITDTKFTEHDKDTNLDARIGNE